MFVVVFFVFGYVCSSARGLHVRWYFFCIWLGPWWQGAGSCRLVGLWGFVWDTHWLCEAPIWVLDGPFGPYWALLGDALGHSGGWETAQEFKTTILCVVVVEVAVVAWWW